MAKKTEDKLTEREEKLEDLKTDPEKNEEEIEFVEEEINELQNTEYQEEGEDLAKDILGSSDDDQ